MKRSYKACLTAFGYIIIMATGMFISHHVFGYDYSSVELAKVLVYFELIMTLFASYLYWHFFKRSFFKIKVTKWFVPLAVMLLLVVIKFVLTGTFNENRVLLWINLFMTFFVGFSEELVFREIVLQSLIYDLGVKKALIISSLLFALLHIVNFFAGLSVIEVLVQVVVTFISGLVFACVVINLDSIIPMFLYHWIWDFMLIVLPITKSDISNLTSAVLILEVLMVVPIFIFTVKNYDQNHS